MDGEMRGTLICDKTDGVDALAQHTAQTGPTRVCHAGSHGVTTCQHDLLASKSRVSFAPCV